MRVWATHEAHPFSPDTRAAAREYGAAQIVRLGSRLSVELGLSKEGGAVIPDPPAADPLITPEERLLEAMVTEGAITRARADRVIARLKSGG